MSFGNETPDNEHRHSNEAWSSPEARASAGVWRWEAAQHVDPADVACGSAADRQDVTPLGNGGTRWFVAASHVAVSDGASASVAISSAPVAGDLDTVMGVGGR